MNAGQRQQKAVCQGLDESAKGLVKLGNQKYAIPYLLPGETAVLDCSGKKDSAPKLQQIESSSLNRVTPRCSCFYQCGGCQLQHLSYQAQLEWKQKRVEGLLSGFGTVRPILGMEEPWQYRNKIHSTLSAGKKGGIVSGIYEENSHRVVPVIHCPIQDAYADEVVASVREAMRSCKLQPYQEDTGKGLIRHILIRRAVSTNQTMVVLVTASQIFPGRNNFVTALRKLRPDITTIVMNVNPKKTSMVLGEQERVLYGKGTIEDTLCGCTFRLSPKSFYQVNPRQTEVLYGQAIELAGLTGTETVIDAYCGIGTIGLIASRHAKRVIGVERNRDAVGDAIQNAKRNHAGNIQFVVGDAGQFLREMAGQGEKADVVFLDPPRSGSDETFLESLCKMSPKRIVYISCNPETQKRDLSYLVKKGYCVKTIQPVDMFPQTVHVETVCLLVHQNK